MEYRKLPHGKEKIGILGMGSVAIGARSEAVITETVSYALDHGINFFDMAGENARIFPAYGAALAGRRKDALLQLHFGADYSSGGYGWTTDLDTIKRSVAWQLEQMRTDYIDFGYIHCLDEDEDLRDYEKSGALDYVLDMKAQGVIHHIGFSTHNPLLANRMLDRGIIDMLMFSINPMYDYGQGKYAIGKANERYDLYRRCEKEGVGIAVMKPLNAGQLLDEKQSSLGCALSVHQCLQYALDQPGVVTVLPGPGSLEELKQLLGYFEASEQARDYSVISSVTPESCVGKCVYCRHCHPCPAGLDIGLINKYYDLARLGDELAKEHYLTLGKTAADCIGCGHCDKRCPFHVAQTEQMQEILTYFGK